MDRLFYPKVVCAHTRTSAGISRLYWNAFPSGFCCTLARLVETIKSLPDLRLVIVDPASKLLRLMDSFNPDEVLLGIEKLEQVAKDHKLHLMFLTHAKKKSNEHDPFDDSMGSTSFRGGTDTNIVLRKHGKDRIISTEQRWGSELEPTFLKGWNEEGQSVELGQTVESQAQEQHQTKAKKVVERIEQDILSALDKKSLTQRQLLTEVSGKSVKILEVLSELVVEGNLTNGIELLNTSIWKYGLHNLSDQVLGYQKKLNQIKTQEVQLSKATAELETAQRAAVKASSAVSEIEQKKAEALAALEQLKQSSAASNLLGEQLKETATKISAVYSTIQQQEKQSGELTASTKTANNELIALDASIRKFYAEVEEYRNKISQTGEDAANLIRASEASVKKLVDGTTATIEAAVEALQKTEKSVTDELTNQVNSKASETQEALVKLSS